MLDCNAPSREGQGRREESVAVKKAERNLVEEAIADAATTAKVTSRMLESFLAGSHAKWERIGDLEQLVLVGVSRQHLTDVLSIAEYAGRMGERASNLFDEMISS